MGLGCFRRLGLLGDPGFQPRILNLVVIGLNRVEADLMLLRSKGVQTHPVAFLVSWVASPNLVGSRRDKIVVHGLILVLAVLGSADNLVVIFDATVLVMVRLPFRILLDCPSCVEVSCVWLLAEVATASVFFVADKDFLALVDMVVHLRLDLAHGNEGTLVWWALGVKGVVRNILIA